MDVHHPSSEYNEISLLNLTLQLLLIQTRFIIILVKKKPYLSIIYIVKKHWKIQCFLTITYQFPMLFEH